MSEPRTWRDAALILRTQKLGETDRIIIMLTRDGGITHAVAKAVRKPTSKFGGRLEPFMHTDLSFSRGRTNLHTITQAATLHAYTAPIMANYDAYTCASTIAELAEALTKDTDSTADIYTLTHGALAALAHGQHVPQRILTRYLARSMNAAGWPLIGENCTRCGNPLVNVDSQGTENSRAENTGADSAPNAAGGSGRYIAFHTAHTYGHHTVLCPQCAPAVDTPLIGLRAEELGYALATASADPRAWATIDAAPVPVASKILGLYLKTTQNLLEHPLKTASALEAEIPAL
ncbi:DNA repair protein RecO [uncultured Rothia sp.]|uniref:DNA repair protein RecO n=1 Tax=uncultured Rothia sp. TaxID=316088 RepID=UPI00288BD43D|nr:DNA repair protein RecO [uncultured Rothia sp.]